MPRNSTSLRSSTWHIRHGRWWMVQWITPFTGWLSVGVHVDLASRRSRLADGSVVRYGPYVDLHLLCAILSVGVNPVHSGDFDASVSVSRGGVRVPD